MLLEGGASILPRAADGLIVTLIAVLPRAVFWEKPSFPQDTAFHLMTFFYSLNFSTLRILSAPSSGVMSLGMKPSQVDR